MTNLHHLPSERKDKPLAAKPFLRIRARNGDGPWRNEVIDERRSIWALTELIKAGQTGVTPLENPAPRWGAYVFKLRHEHGIIIETIHELHRGRFPGRHGRYVLRSDVHVIEHYDPAVDGGAK